LFCVLHNYWSSVFMWLNRGIWMFNLISWNWSHACSGMNPPFLYFTHFQYMWWFLGTPVPFTMKSRLWSLQIFNSRTKGLVSFIFLNRLFWCCCVKIMHLKTRTTRPYWDFLLFLHQYWLFYANSCTCCIGSHSLVKCTRCRTLCNLEYCAVVLWKTLVWIFPEISFFKIQVTSSWRKCTFWFLFCTFLLLNFFF
jgi:hypothetical protein